MRIGVLKRFGAMLVGVAVVGCSGGGEPSGESDQTTVIGDPSASQGDVPEEGDVSDEIASAAGDSVSADPPANSAVADVSGGVLAGVVRFEGDVPPPRRIQVTKDEAVCGIGAGEAQDVVVNDGLLAGAVVELTVRSKNGPEFTAPAAGFVIRQKNCRFSPRLIVAYDGAELTIYNDDPVAHNVNSGLWNYVQSPGKEPLKETIRYGGQSFVRVTCNIHSWMETWVYVARSPYYCVTGKDGSFRIEGIPAGTRIRGTVSHSTLGKQRFTIDVQPGAAQEKQFVFAGN